MELQKNEINEYTILEVLFGKGVLLFLMVMTPLSILLTGGVNDSILGISHQVIEIISVCFLFYYWRLVLILKDKGFSDKVETLSVMVVYSAANLYIGSGINVDFVIFLGIFQGLILNGYINHKFYGGSMEYYHRMMDLLENKIKKEKEKNKVEESKVKEVIKE